MIGILAHDGEHEAGARGIRDDRGRRAAMAAPRPREARRVARVPARARVLTPPHADVVVAGEERVGRRFGDRGRGHADVLDAARVPAAR